MCVLTSFAIRLLILVLMLPGEEAGYLTMTLSMRS